MTKKIDRNPGPTPVGRLLAESVELSPTSRIDRERWRRIVGERVSERTRPGSLRNGVLTVHVASSVWAQELSLLSSSIIERLTQAGITASSLRFRVDEVDTAPAKRGQKKPATAVALPEDLARRLRHVQDPSLRAAIAEAAAYSLARSAKPLSEKHPATRDPRSAASRTAPTDRNPTPPDGARRRIDGKRGR